MAYIKLDDALKVCSDYEEWYADMNDQCGATIANNIYQEIVNLPTSDVVEVKHGEWIEEFAKSTIDRLTGEDFTIVYRCSRCGRYESQKEPYCNCGAKMDGGKAE